MRSVILQSIAIALLLLGTGIGLLASAQLTDPDDNEAGTEIRIISPAEMDEVSGVVDIVFEYDSGSDLITKIEVGYIDLNSIIDAPLPGYVMITQISGNHSGSDEVEVQWDTTDLAEGHYFIRVEIETLDGSSLVDDVLVVLGETDPINDTDSILRGTVLLDGQPVNGAIVVVIGEVFYYPMEDPCYYADEVMDTFCGYPGGPFFADYDYEDSDLPPMTGDGQFDLLEEYELDLSEYDDLFDELFDEEYWDDEDYYDDRYDDFEDDWFDEDFDDYWDEDDYYDNWDDDWFAPPMPEMIELYFEYAVTDENGYFEFEVFGDVSYSLLVLHSDDLDLLELVETLEQELPDETEFPDIPDDRTYFDENWDDDEYWDDEGDWGDEWPEIPEFPGMDMVILPGDNWTQYVVHYAYRDVFVDFDVAVEVTMDLDEVVTIMLPEPSIDVDDDEVDDGDADAGDEPADEEDDEELGPTNALVSGQDQAASSGISSIVLMLGLAVVGLLGLAYPFLRRK